MWKTTSSLHPRQKFASGEMGELRFFNFLNNVKSGYFNEIGRK